MSGSQWLRLLVVVGLAFNAWDGWQRRPRAVRHGGRRYYPLADGRFATAWGRIVTDPARVVELRCAMAADTAATPAAPEEQAR